MKPKLPRNLLWKNYPLALLLRRSLNKKIYDIWAESYAGTHLAPALGGKILNEAYYQCVKAVYENSPDFDIDQLELDIKANVGLRLYARDVVRIMYAILMSRENNTNEINQYRDKFGDILLVNSGVYKEFIQKAKKRENKQNIDLSPKPWSASMLNHLTINWPEVTREFNLEAIRMVVELWEEAEQKLMVIGMIEDAFNRYYSDTNTKDFVVSIDLSALKDEIRRNEGISMAAEEGYDDYLYKTPLQKKEEEIRDLKAMNAKMRTLVEQLKSEQNSQKSKKKQERSFTLSMILDYCENRTTHVTGPVIIAMLNLFLRDSGNSTAEERDMVDKVEYKILHPDNGDKVQGNKTSFDNNSNMVNFNLPENVDFEKFFAALPEDLKQMMMTKLISNDNG